MPLLAELSFNYGEMLAKEYRWDKAEERFRSSVRLDPFSSIYPSGYAEFLRKSARYSYERVQLSNKAILLYDRAIALEPENGEYYLKRGLARLEAGKPVAEGFADLHEAFRRDPNGYSVAYAIGYTGMNFWKSLDGKEKDYVAGRLAYVIKTDPNQSQKAYDAAWKASKDFGLLKRIAADAQQGMTGLYGFMVSHNLWQYRKEIALATEETPEHVNAVKARIIEAEKLAEAGAWERSEGKTVLARGGEAILARAKARNGRRQNGLVAAEDWALLSLDKKKISYTNGALNANGTIYSLADVTDGNSFVIIEAKGSPLKKVWPYMIVMVDGREVGEAFVDGAEMKAYEFKVKTRRGRALISVRFMNDANDPAGKEDRNLWVGSVKITRN